MTLRTEPLQQAISAPRHEAGTGPLAGIRVLDLTRVVMGPFATQILGDQGADVIAVEPLEGDTNRVMGPGPHPELSGIALNLMRNKRSVAIDLKDPESTGLVERLIRSSDVVVTTMRPGAVDRLGLDYESVRRIRPNVIYCQGQGYPLASDRANEPAYDDVIQAATGVSDIIERVTGEPGLVPSIFADKVCGIAMAQAITAALLHRERTGEGQHVEVAMTQTMTAFMLAEHGSGAISVPPVNDEGKPAAGYPRILTPERRPHRTQDGLIHMFPYRPEHYAALFDETGLEGEGGRERFEDQRATIANADSLYRDVRAACATRTTQEWLDFCTDAGIPVTRVATLQAMIDDLPTATHHVAGTYRALPALTNFKTAPLGLRRPAPLIGQDTEAIREELERADPLVAAIEREV